MFRLTLVFYLLSYIAGEGDRVGGTHDREQGTNLLVSLVTTWLQKDLSTDVCICSVLQSGCITLSSPLKMVRHYLCWVKCN